MRASLKVIGAGCVASLAALMLVGCGPSADDKRRDEVQAMCASANEAMSAVGIDEIVPPGTGDWAKIQTLYGGISSTLQSLSNQATSLQEDQLARDFASVGKDAKHLEAVASLIQTIGYNTLVADEWLTSVNKFTGNAALRSNSDRTFIGCV